MPISAYQKRIDFWLTFDSKSGHECEDFVFEVIIRIVAVLDVIFSALIAAGAGAHLWVSMLMLLFVWCITTFLPIFKSKEVKKGGVEFGAFRNEVPLGVEMAVCFTAFLNCSHRVEIPDQWFKDDHYVEEYVQCICSLITQDVKEENEDAEDVDHRRDVWDPVRDQEDEDLINPSKEDEFRAKYPVEYGQPEREIEGQIWKPGRYNPDYNIPTATTATTAT